jgi:hypothetical protein
MISLPVPKPEILKASSSNKASSNVCQPVERIDLTTREWDYLDASSDNEAGSNDVQLPKESDRFGYKKKRDDPVKWQRAIRPNREGNPNDQKYTSVMETLKSLSELQQNFSESFSVLRATLMETMTPYGGRPTEATK